MFAEHLSAGSQLFIRCMSEFVVIWSAVVSMQYLRRRYIPIDERQYTYENKLGCSGKNDKNKVMFT